MACEGQFSLGGEHDEWKKGPWLRQVSFDSFSTSL